MTWALAAVMLASSVGCTAVFDIGQPEAVDSVADTDDDGVIDVRDNCVSTPNRDQADADEDTLGDACDGCPGVLSTSNHDEDLDGMPDACDACPAIADFADQDSDSDGVGDLCDLAGDAMTERRLFDPFTTLDPLWHGDGVWTVTSDEALTAMSPQLATSRGLVRDEVTLGNDDWIVLASVVSTRSWQPFDRAGIVMTGVGGGVAACTLECTAIDCGLVLTVDNKRIAPNTSVPNPFLMLRLEVKLVDPTGNVHSFECRLSDGSVSSDQVTSPATSWHPGVVANDAIHVGYIDVIE